MDIASVLIKTTLFIKTIGRSDLFIDYSLIAVVHIEL